jgi:hypothetical protein
MTNTLKCPNCAQIIDVSEVLAKQTEDRVRKEFNDKWSKLKEDNNREIEARKAEIEKRELEYKKQLLHLENEKLQQKELLEAQVIKQVKQEREKWMEKSREEVQEEFKEVILTLKKQLDQKSEETKDLHKIQLDLETIKREKDELEAKIKLESERTLFEKLKETKAIALQEAEQKYVLELREKEKFIADQNKMIDDMKRKAEQGSQQTQGEILEWMIEHEIKQMFPSDEIQEVKKGVYGADLKVQVRNAYLQNCGKIIIECKNTKDWQNKWIDKLKQDKIEAKADIAILITKDFPRGKENFSVENEIYICGYQYWKPVLQTLRDGILRVHEIAENQVNKGEKMEILYDYLRSNEFKNLLQNIVDAFSAMRENLEKEKRNMQKQWAEREKQIEKIQQSTIQIYGNIRGIAGNAISEIKTLELDD